MDNFVEFPKIVRWNREVIVTEKIDGTNAQVFVHDDGLVIPGSRSRYLDVAHDNFGFAKWVKEHEDELRELGPGRHFGEWWGPGIQRRYSIKEKTFSLFNVHCWGEKRPACCAVVPTLFRGKMEDLNIEEIMSRLSQYGSVASPGFMQPEGIIVYHTASHTMFKKTFENDECGKGI